MGSKMTPGMGSKMTPGVNLKAWHDGEIEVTAMAFHENYSTGGRYLFLLLSRKICGRLKVTPSLYILGHGVILTPEPFYVYVSPDYERLHELWTSYHSCVILVILLTYFCRRPQVLLCIDR